MTAQRGHFERPTGADLIAAERARQVEQEGWTPEHDAQHSGEALAIAACCYALPPTMRKWRQTGVGPMPTLWPWPPGYWKPAPDDRIRELVKAGALIAAEIDRLQAALVDQPAPGTDSSGQAVQRVLVDLLDVLDRINVGRVPLALQEAMEAGRAAVAGFHRDHGEEGQ